MIELVPTEVVIIVQTAAIIERTARAIGHNVLVCSGNMTEELITRVLRRLKEHVLVIPQAADVRLPSQVVIKLLALLPCVFSDELLLLLLVPADACRFLGRLVEGRKAVTAG